MSVVSMIDVARWCEIIKVYTKECLCGLEFKYLSLLFDTGFALHLSDTGSLTELKRSY